MLIGDLRTLVNAEKELAKVLANVVFIGESRFFDQEYHRKHSLTARRIVGGQSQRVSLVPPRMLLVLMVLCARLNDISEHGFWDCFLRSIGLQNDQNSQAACRTRFRAARKLLQNLHFPQGGYPCVTPILYHAVIPQACIPEMASLIHKLDKEVGWDAIAEMEPQQLEFHLPTATSRAHASKPLCRFVGDAQSRRIAAQLVRDLCEAAHLHKTGEFLTEEIEALLRDYPIQQEIWREMLLTQKSLPGTFTLYSLFTPPSWQWDVKSRELRIHIPRQRVAQSARSVALSAKNQIFPVRARFTGDAWEVEPTYISHALIHWSGAATRLRFGLVDENGKWLRSWYIKPLSEGALFFRPNATTSIGMHVDRETGLPSGDCLILLRHGLQISDVNGNIEATRRWYPPRGFDEYDALSVTIQPPASVVNSEGDILETIAPAIELRHSLQLSGNLLAEADDPSGIPAFINKPPEVSISLKRLEEMQGLSIQCRALSVNGPKLSLHNIEKLIADGIAQWSPQNLKIQVPLGELLPKSATGHFRIRLLYGLQSAGHQPAEFFIVPQTRFIPSHEELEKTLFTSECPPTVVIESPVSLSLESDKGQIVPSANGVYRISWLHQETEFNAILSFANLSIPMRWRPHVLRAGVSSTEGLPLWSKSAIVLPDTVLTFSERLHIEALPGADYEIYVDDEKKQSGQFDIDGRVDFPLAVFSEIVRSSRKDQTSVVMRIITQSHQHSLPLLHVLKVGSDRNGEVCGAMISRIPIRQSVIHPAYGIGFLEDFTDKRVDGTSIRTARFHFQRYEHVQFFIPVARRIPLYWL